MENYVFMYNVGFHKIHTLKIEKDYADSKLFADKLFEIRKNDRGYQKGDVVRYIVINKSGNEIQHALSDKAYLITYVTNYHQTDDYVVFGEKDITEKLQKDKELASKMTLEGRDFRPDEDDALLN